MLIHLYVKTHNVTGLKYFGKTTSKDPYEYKGSGKYWVRHIKKYGYDVTSEIIGSYTDLEECKQIALQFSIDNDIVNSKDWANLKLECLDGGWDYVNENYSKTNRIKSASIGGCASRDQGKGVHSLTKEERKIIVQKSLETQKRLGVGLYNNDVRIEGVMAALSDESREKRKNTFSKIEHQQGTKNSQFGTMWITDGFENKKIKKEDVIPDGWYKGRKCK